MLHRVLVQKLGYLSRRLPRLREPSLTRMLVNGFTSVAEFDKITNETLESLYDRFDELMDQHSSILDNELKDGVLTLWLSSPKSGPKRYDYFEKEDAWIYRRTKESLHLLLQAEMSDILQANINFLKCHHSGRAKS